MLTVLRPFDGYFWIQVWDPHGLSKCVNLTALNKHGRVYDDSKTRLLSLGPSHLSIIWSLIWWLVCFQPSLAACHGPGVSVNYCM